MSWRKTFGRSAWASGFVALVAMFVMAVSNCVLQDLKYEEPCLDKSSYSYVETYCAVMREKCWDSSVPPSPDSEYRWGKDWDTTEVCIKYRNRYPEDNPNPDLDGGTDGDIESPDGGEGGGGGSGGSDAGADASAASGGAQQYAYSCIPRAPDYHNDPQPVWFGPSFSAPKSCPYELGAFGGLSYFDVRNHGQKMCPQCTCSPPIGDCSGALESLHLRSGSCNQVSSTAIDFGPPKDWNGSCDSDQLINLNSSCNPRNGIPCVGSVQTGTLAMPEQKCEVVELPVIKSLSDQPIWGQTALSCNAQANDDIEHADWETCIPSTKDWRSCVHADHYGVYDCEPKSDYRDRFVVYPKDAIIDNRQCSACECSAIGGSCTGELVVYSDDSCLEPIVSLPVDSSETHCKDIPENTQTLGSKELTKLEYVPGMCDARGGETSGSIEFDETYAVTWCCLRLDYVRPPQPFK